MYSLRLVTPKKGGGGKVTEKVIFRNLFLFSKLSTIFNHDNCHKNQDRNIKFSIAGTIDIREIQKI